MFLVEWKYSDEMLKKCPHLRDEWQTPLRKAEYSREQDAIDHADSINSWSDLLARVRTE